MSMMKGLMGKFLSVKNRKGMQQIFDNELVKQKLRSKLKLNAK